MCLKKACRKLLKKKRSPPNGLQEGLSQSVAILVDEGPEVEELANQAGYRFFTDVKSFRHYVNREILSATEAQ